MSYKYEYLQAGKTNLVDGILELRPGTTLYAADSFTHNYRIESWMGRFNYDFDEKYYFSASVRRDGSSRFYKATAGEPSGQSEVTGVSLKKHSFRM